VSVDPLAYLFSLEQFGIKVGLDNIRAIVEALGHPERASWSIHVAGTNGKGSVTAMIESVLRAAGIHTGRYTSPHLVDLTERFAIDGVPVNLDALCDAVATVRDAVTVLQAQGRLDVHPTFFEVTTAAGFELFRRARVEATVCEVGLGGRLDATNVLSPVACAITSIAFDHQQYLGDTLEAIATEKAGIIKPDVPVVVGTMDPTAHAVIARVAQEQSAPLIDAREGVIVRRHTQTSNVQTFELTTPRREYGPVTLGLAGTHQLENALVAIRVLEEIDARGHHVPSDAILNGLAHVHWPGRLERIVRDDGRELLLDAAHNTAGAETLARFLAADVKRPLVFAAMKDKDASGILRLLVPVVSAIVITRPSHPRAADPQALADLAIALAPDIPVEVEASPRAALDAAWRFGPRIVVAGSIFLLGDVMKVLCGS
jgi:dihydrofolate synthase/folylpolyglutamate synthase